LVLSDLLAQYPYPPPLEQKMDDSCICPLKIPFGILPSIHCPRGCQMCLREHEPTFLSIFSSSKVLLVQSRSWETVCFYLGHVDAVDQLQTLQLFSGFGFLKWLLH